MKRYVLGFSFLLMSSCSVDTAGLGSPENFRISAEPDTICPGDTSRLRWEALNVPRSPEYCADPYQTGSVCTTTGECESDETCIDQQCIAPGDDPQEIDFGDGCPIDGDIRINQLDLLTNEVAPVGESTDRVRGLKAVAPPNTTVYTALFDVDGERVATQSVTVTVLGQDPVTENIGFGTLFCRSAGDTLRRALGTTAAGFDPSSSVVLTLVTNQSAAGVFVASSLPSHPAVFLASGASTTDFNGSVPQEWSVRLDPTAVPPPTSCAVDTGGFEPIEVQLALTVTCGP